MVGSRLGRRIWAVGSVRRCLAEGGVVGAERSVNLIGGDVEKAERGAVGTVERRPVGSRLLKQAECAVDIRADKIIGAMNGAVDVAFGGKMNDGSRLFAPQQAE